MTVSSLTRAARPLFLLGSIAALALVPATASAGPAQHPALLAPAAPKFPKGTVMMLHKKMVQIAIKGYAFNPDLIAVSPGTKIVWTNKDDAPHTVTAVKISWTSATLNTGGHYSHTFAKVGRFDYDCTVHPFMLGSVFVTK
jgi:plastocyanin